MREGSPMSQSSATMTVPLPRMQLRPDPVPEPDASSSTVNARAKPEHPLIDIRAVSVFYGEYEAIKRVSLTLPEHRVIAFIGPSGCGKSTLLRSINRLN